MSEDRIISFLEKIGRVAHDVASEIEREKAKKPEQNEKPTTGRSEPQNSATINSRIVTEIRNENMALRGKVARQTQQILDANETNERLRSELARKNSLIEAINAQGSQVLGDKDKEIESLTTMLADAQAQQKRDVEELKQLHSVCGSDVVSANLLQEQFNKLAARPLPTSQSSLARRLNIFARAVGLSSPPAKKKS